MLSKKKLALFWLSCISLLAFLFPKHSNYLALRVIPETCHANSSWNENLNLLVRIKFLNLFFNRVLNKNWKNVLVRTKFYWSWTGGPVLIVRNKVLLVLDWRTGAHHEEQKFTGLGLEDQCSSWRLCALNFISTFLFSLLILQLR